MINNVLNTDGFYFCTDFDLTHTLQRLANTSPDFQEMSLLERVSCLPPSQLGWLRLPQRLFELGSVAQRQVRVW